MNKNLSVQIFRLSGIYSIENNILIRLKLGTAKIVNNRNRVKKEILFLTFFVSIKML